MERPHLALLKLLLLSLHFDFSGHKLHDGRVSLSLCYFFFSSFFFLNMLGVIK